MQAYLSLGNFIEGSRTKWQGKNGTDKMARTKWYRQNHQLTSNPASTANMIFFINPASNQTHLCLAVICDLWLLNKNSIQLNWNLYNLIPFCPRHFVRTILSNTILSGHPLQQFEIDELQNYDFEHTVSFFKYCTCVHYSACLYFCIIIYGCVVLLYFQQIRSKNRYLKQIIDQQRIVVWEINTMLAMRKTMPQKDHTDRIGLCL